MHAFSFQKLANRTFCLTSFADIDEAYIQFYFFCQRGVAQCFGSMSFADVALSVLLVLHVS